MRTILASIYESVTQAPTPVFPLAGMLAAWLLPLWMFFLVMGAFALLLGIAELYRS